MTGALGLTRVVTDAVLEVCMNTVMSDLTPWVVVWGRVMAYKGAELMEEIWRGVEVTISGVEQQVLQLWWE